MQFNDDGKAWLPNNTLRTADPYTLINHAYTHGYHDKPGFEWINKYLSAEDDMEHLLKVYSAKGTPVKYKFGVEVPKNRKHALELDAKSGTTGWRDSIQLELDQIMSYEVFKVWPADQPLPTGYKRIPYHIVYDVKFDGRLKSRLVAGGHMSGEVPKEESYSSVVSMEAMRLGFMLAKLNGLVACAGDVGNAFLYGTTREKVYIVAGPEFGPKLEGKRLIIDKSLYGLKTSGARFHEHLSTQLQKLDFKPTKADPDLWMRKHLDGYYEYIAWFVDDVIAFSKDPLKIMKELEKTYVMKGVGAPRYYLGGDVLELDGQWNRQGLEHAFSAATYIDQALPKLAKLLGVEQFAKKMVPFDPDYHAELDDSPLLDADGISKYRSIIGSLNWILTLGRFDIAYSLSTLSRYNMAPRQGHMEALKRVLGYLYVKRNGQIIIDDGTPGIRRKAMISSGHSWSEFYPDAEEDIPSDMPKPFGNLATLTCYVDADHARDKVTRRSVTGIVLLVNNTPLTWISKRQKTVETSTYGSELVAARIATDLIIEWRYKLRMLGIVLEDTSMLVGDNMSVVVNTTLPSSALKKKHQACNYHRIREAIAGRIITFGHIDTNDNVADVCTKPLNGPQFHKLCEEYLFRKPDALKRVIEGE